uniref:Uncharacterized protein n=1 Tax=Picea glauca TaxID=3330 RepID=A0A117NGF1_PICGL|nr:hypothetical protein ABT39_MTgene1383 [Picea glauca]
MPYLTAQELEAMLPPALLDGRNHLKCMKSDICL